MAQKNASGTTKFALNLNDESVDLPEPPGYSSEYTRVQSKGGGSSGGSNGKREKQESDSEFKQKKAMEFARSPGRSLMMYAFMLYMSGNNIQLFSIATTYSVISQPVKALASVHSSFAKFEGENVNLAPAKLMYIACNLAGLAVGLYKLNAMGLLPTHASDWLSSLQPLPYKEVVGGGEPIE